MDKKLLIIFLVMGFFGACTTVFCLSLSKLICDWSYVFGEFNIGFILITNELIINKYAEELQKSYWDRLYEKYSE